VRITTKQLKICFAAFLFPLLFQHMALAGPPALIISVNGGFESGLAAWTTSGDVALETGHPLEGKRSVRIGPGAGSISQYIQVGSNNHLNLSALLHSEPASAGELTIRLLDKNGRELMHVDSNTDMKRGKNPDEIRDYLKPHPLTARVQIVISKDSTPGYVYADGISLGAYEENDPSLKSKENLTEAMRPIWEGNKVTDEAVLMVSHDGKPATGTLMFHPSRILSVTDYGSTNQYVENADFSVVGRTMICAPGSRMTQLNQEDFLKGDLKWNVVGGKQILVTYEHSDVWTGPVQAYVGNELPNTIWKLSAHEPLKIVAFGDSITFGIGSSRILKIPPFQPPWIELFSEELGKTWNDQAITLYNSSQSGADSEWAKSMAQRMVASLDPDLVVIAFGQNDFWRIQADAFASNISAVIETVRSVNPQAEFLLVSTMQFDPDYSRKVDYWDLVSQYESKLKALTGPGVQSVDFTTISGAVFAAKAPKDCLNDPLHPDDYLSRWYAQSLVAALVPARKQAPALAFANFQFGILQNYSGRLSYSFQDRWDGF
jgi:lysophospholipase L1-like esterase